jgi:hypothetical protein
VSYAFDPLQDRADLDTKRGVLLTSRPVDEQAAWTHHAFTI